MPESLRDEGVGGGGGKKPEVGELSLGDGGDAPALTVELVPGRSLPRDEYPREGPASLRACRNTLKIGGV